MHLVHHYASIYKMSAGNAMCRLMNGYK